ncbi:hypothetical protein MN116_000713 [Schistosoma mekongi]|uniref:Uncharacterized protein n=1 Tax=Schistosoma mekongi TaxID=38744 RepID=A0AAE1ZIE9_SCHME|nr:hypothetical protein MN116_000713 [Schistosoma mekongi]
MTKAVPLTLASHWIAGGEDEECSVLSENEDVSSNASGGVGEEYDAANHCNKFNGTNNQSPECDNGEGNEMFSKIPLENGNSNNNYFCNCDPNMTNSQRIFQSSGDVNKDVGSGSYLEPESDANSTERSSVNAPYVASGRQVPISSQQNTSGEVDGGSYRHNNNMSSFGSRGVARKLSQGFRRQRALPQYITSESKLLPNYGMPASKESCLANSPTRLKSFKTDNDWSTRYASSGDVMPQSLLPFSRSTSPYYPYGLEVVDENVSVPVSKHSPYILQEMVDRRGRIQYKDLRDHEYRESEKLINEFHCGPLVNSTGNNNNSNNNNNNNNHNYLNTWKFNQNNNRFPISTQLNAPSSMYQHLEPVENQSNHMSRSVVLPHSVGDTSSTYNLHLHPLQLNNENEINLNPTNSSYLNDGPIPYKSPFQYTASSPCVTKPLTTNTIVSRDYFRSRPDISSSASRPYYVSQSINNHSHFSTARRPTLSITQNNTLLKAPFSKSEHNLLHAVDSLPDMENRRFQPTVEDDSYLIEYPPKPTVYKSLMDTNQSIEIIKPSHYQMNMSKPSTEHTFERLSRPNSLYFLRPTQRAVDM